MSIWVLFAVLLILAEIQHVLVCRFALPRLKYKRFFSVCEAFEGDEVELVEVIRNDRFLLIPWLRVETKVSPYLRFGSRENLDIRATAYHKSIFLLMPFQQVTRRHKVQLLRRGQYDLGHVALTAGDLISIGSNTSELTFPDTVINVYPRLLPPDAVPLPVSKLQGDLIIRRHLIADPFLINGIRPYQCGDNRRDIHWGATARTGQMQVKTHDYTADTRLMIVLNGQMRADQWGDLMDYETAAIEHGLSLAATAAARVLPNGIPVGFAANMPFLEEKECAYLSPAWHATRLEELLLALSKIRIVRVKRFPTLLDDLAAMRDADFLILTPYADAEIEEKMAALRQAGNTATICLIGSEARHEE